MATRPPKNYKKGEAHIDPFAKDKPLFTISAANLAKYKNNLTATHRHMIKNYNKSYKMNVYRTRRSCSLPKNVYSALEQNRKNARLAKDGNAVERSIVASPFPVPKKPVEIYWNHNLYYQGLAHEETVEGGRVGSSGFYVPSIRKQKKLFYYANPKTSKKSLADNIHFDWFSKVISPALVAGMMFSFTNTVDQLKDPRRGFSYDTNRRRTSRVPSNASRYSAPMSFMQGLRLSDDLFIFNGSPDRYNWKLLGKKEIYIPYNVYQLSNTKKEELIKPNHLNQKTIRYELHRVWVLEANLKSGFQHPYHRRVFYVDEDSWIIAAADIYDKSDKQIRGQIAFIKNYYQEPACRQDFDVMYFFGKDFYYVENLKNGYEPSNMSPKISPNDFGTKAMRRQAR